MSAKQSQIVRALRIVLVAMCATAVYEAIKLICVPRLTLVQSNITSIFFAGCVGFCISFIIRERGKAEQQELLRLAAIVQQSDDAIIGTELDGTITSWNRGAEQIYGYSAGEVLGRHISLSVPPEKHAELSAVLQKIANGEAVERLHTRRLKKNGGIIDLSLSVFAIKDGTGKIVGASGIARDVTAHRRAETELCLRSAALEAAANGILITDRQGTIVWANQAFTTMTGYSKEELLGKNPRLLKSGEQPDSYYAKLWSTISSGKVWQGEIINRRKDGTTYAEEMTITPVIQDGNAADTHFVAIKQDITERKQIENALGLAEERYRTIFEDAVVGIVQTTSEGRPLNVNRALAEMHGYDSPEQLLAEVSNVAHQLFVDPGRMDELTQVLARNGVVRGAEVEVYCRDRTKKWVLVNLRAVRDPQGNIVLHEGTVEDITDRKAAEERAQYLAYYDALTGLPNRTLLQDRLSKALASARRQKDKVALLFLDLDRFKDINDWLGHSVGDLLLQDVAERLKRWGRDQDTVARIGETNSSSC